MKNKKIIAGITSLVVVAGIITGVTSYLNKDYDAYTISGTNNTVSETDVSSSETDNSPESSTVKKAVQSVEYETALFGDEIITIDITVDEDEWQNMLDNATAEEYISVDININGNIMQDVGIRPKGNSTLSTVADSGSDKYSFKMKFDKYVDEQTCLGLDTLVLNNIISDNTYMKDYMSFDMMKFMEVDSALYNYSYITVNGEYWGLYVALEAYDKSFLNRTYGDDEGFLYNVKTMEVDGGAMGGFEEFQSLVTTPAELTEETSAVETMPEDGENAVPDMGYIPEMNGGQMIPFETDENGQPVMPDMNNFMGGMDMMNKDTGGSLMYTDDSWESYSAIFENAVFNRTSEEDYQRVITALKKLADGENIDEYFDIDQILRYLAVHTTLVNLDSYSSNMAQNYYLYEKDGKLSILPWDYNLAFGGFMSEDSISAINFPIDTPVSGVSLEERPLIAQILAIDEYREKYHEYLNQIVEEYFESGYFEEKIDTISSKISTYVEEEPQAFCTYDEYQTAVSTLKAFGEKRAESIKGQLDGSIPSTSEEQQKNSEALIKDENINIGDMGTQMGGGKGHGGFYGGQMQHPDMNNGQIPFETDESGQMVMPEGGYMQHPDMNNGQMPFETDESGQMVMPEGGYMQRPDMNNGQIPSETDENGQFEMPEEEQIQRPDMQIPENVHDYDGNMNYIYPQDEDIPAQTQVYEEQLPANNEWQNYNNDNRNNNEEFEPDDINKRF